MDKNKDFIRVDDVFKSLEHGEERYRSGAWGQMKDLLDKQMPVTTGASSGGSIYRYLIPVLVLLLAGFSYYFWENYSEENNTMVSHSMVTEALPSGQPAANLKSPVNTANTTVKNNSVTQDKINDKSGYYQTVVGNEKNGIVSKKNAGGKTSGKKQQPSPDHSQITVAMLTSVNHGVKHAAKEESRNNSRFVRLQQSEQTQANTITDLLAVNTKVSGLKQRNQTMNSLVNAEINSSDLQSTPVFKTKNIAQTIIVQQQSLSVLQKETVIEQYKPALTSQALNEKRDGSATEELALEHQLTKITENNSKTSLPELYRSESGGLYKEQKDTFNRMLLVRKTASGYLPDLRKKVAPAFDTVSLNRVARVSFVPLSYAEIKLFHLVPKAISSTVSAPASTSGTGGVELADNTQHMANLVPLAHYKVSSRKMDAGAISRLLESANSGITGLVDGNKNWYISLLLGGNAGLGGPSSYGMQVGASFLYSLAERWTMSIGLKYQKHYYSDFKFWDSAISYAINGKQTPNGTLFSGTEYHTNTSVSANSLSRLSLPILVSYNLGRVAVFAGPEFSYLFPLEHEKTSAVQTNYVSKMAFDNKNPFVPLASRLDAATDFRSRFGAGYSFGLSYDFSRNLSIDVRMNQMLWDNTGKYQLDALKHIYRQPAVEINLDFFLGRKDKVIYIMDRNK